MALSIMDTSGEAHFGHRKFAHVFVQINLGLLSQSLCLPQERVRSSEQENPSELMSAEEDLL